MSSTDAHVLKLTRLQAKLNQMLGLSFSAVPKTEPLHRITTGADDRVLEHALENGGNSFSVPLHAILDSAALVSSTMCAPPSWLTGGPIVGFSPPAPFAHEIRNGVLNRLERERVVDLVVKRKIVQEEGRDKEGGIEDGQAKNKGKRKREEGGEVEVKKEWKEGEIQLSAKDLEMLNKLKEEKRLKKEAKKKAKAEKAAKKKKGKSKKVVASNDDLDMNLSDSD